MHLFIHSKYIIFMASFKLPAMSDVEITNLMNEQKICRIAFRGLKHPYIAPFQFTQIDGVLYFHFTNYGRKMKLILKDKKVCVCIERLESDMNRYNFLSILGSLEEVMDNNLKKNAINKLSIEGREQYSKNFLAAHGLPIGSHWDDLPNKKPLVIFKLSDITKIIGLKSPS